MDESARTHGLNRAQRTSVTVTLRLLERALARIAAVLDETKEGILTRTVTPLPPARLAAARQLVGSLRQEIAATASTFALQSEVVDGRRVIVGQLAIAWENLEEARAAKLRAYGQVGPELIATLDPHIERLIVSLLTLEQLVGGGSPANSSSSPWPTGG